jgi:TRAP-type C4-dicarboxylate transport system substrate-binding protein
MDIGAALRLTIFAFLVAVAATPSSVLAQSAGEGAEVWKLSVAVGPSFALGKAADRWAKAIGERSEGKIAVRTFPGASLAHNDPAREFLALREGAADLAVGSTLYWSSQVVDFNLYALPWLAAEERALAALSEGAVAERLMAAAERAGVVPLALAVLGHRAVATSSGPLRDPSDFARIKIRGPSSTLVTNLLVELGALPRTMPSADAQAAFRSGALEAQEGSLATLAAVRVDTLGMKQVFLWNATAECAMFAVNKAAWARWTDEQRAIVREAALEAARELPALARAENDAAQDSLVKRGVTITRLTPSGRAAFIAATRHVYERWAGAMDADLVRAAEAAVKGAQ